VSNAFPQINPEPPAAPPQDLHARFLAILPRIRAHAEVRFRGVRCPAGMDDAVAEVAAVCWAWFLRLSARGKDAASFPSALAGLAVRHVRSGRGLCGRRGSNDALSPLAWRKRCFSALPLPAGEAAGEGGQALEGLRDDAATPPPDQAAFRIDFPRWLGRLGTRRRGIALDLAQSRTTGEVASRRGLSPGRVSQLRRELRRDWLLFHGEPA
jgi:hypothetical protein